MSPTPLTFYVPSMNYDASNNIDIVYDTVPGMDQYDASATLDVSYQAIKDLFRFSTTNLHLATDISTLQDLHFYVDDPSVNNYTGNYLGALDITKSIVTVNNIQTGNTDPTKGLVDGQQVVGVDFIQSLSYKMFKSGYYDTFFVNANSLRNDIEYQMRTSYRNISMNSIKAISATAGTDNDLKTDSNGKYLDDTVVNKKNISRIIMETIFRNDSQRFNIETGLVSNTTDMQSIPLVKGDTLQFIVTLSPSATQNAPSNPNPGRFPNGQNVSSLTRKYLVNLVLSD